MKVVNERIFSKIMTLDTTKITKDSRIMKEIHPSFVVNYIGNQ